MHIVEQIAQAKRSGPEAGYLRRMQRDTRLRERLIQWGTA
jgi:hypothetical protein